MRLLALALLLVSVVVSDAQAGKALQPLVDIPPTRSLAGRTTVIDGDAAATVRTVQGSTRTYSAGDGVQLRITVSSSYGDNTDVARTYASFLGSLLHGSELSKLRMTIATPDEVVAECGGVEGTLACYDQVEQLMIVPGEQPADAEGIPVSYIVAHEYGHHVAANRSNKPFSAIDYGPKFWASEQLVCLGTIQGVLSPGDQGFGYAANPGEAFAETYAQLKYPDSREWAYTARLTPTAAALAAAQRDVTDPWTGSKERRFRGTFTDGGPKTRRYRFKLRLDGSLSVRLSGPKASNFDLSISSEGQEQGSTTAAGSNDALSYEAACREQAVETVTVTVKRIQGAGRFKLTARFAG